MRALARLSKRLTPREHMEKDRSGMVSGTSRKRDSSHAAEHDKRGLKILLASSNDELQYELGVVLLGKVYQGSRVQKCCFLG